MMRSPPGRGGFWSNTADLMQSAHQTEMESHLQGVMGRYGMLTSLE